MSRGKWTRTLPLVEDALVVPTPARLAVLGDTHVTAARSHSKLAYVYEFFRRAQVDLIMHAGDVGSATVLHELQAIAPVAAVRGNADPLDVIESLPDRMSIEIGTRTVLLIHGHLGKTALATARGATSPDIDLIVFGHSHRPLIEKKEHTILFNPGSPTDRRWNPHFGIGLIAISDVAIAPDLILFDDPQRLEHVAPWSQELT